MKKLFLIAVIALAFVIAGTLIFKHTAETPNSEPESPAQEPASGATYIIMKDSGYEPSKITVPAGTEVVFINRGTKNHWPASNIHPTHQIYPEFDPKKAVAPGESWSFIFGKPGIWRLHDHLYPNITGAITVQ